MRIRKTIDPEYPKKLVVWADSKLDFEGDSEFIDRMPVKKIWYDLMEGNIIKHSEDNLKDLVYWAVMNIEDPAFEMFQNIE